MTSDQGHALPLADALAAPEHALSADFVAYWESRRRGTAYPGRRDIDPLIDVPHVAPHMTLLDIVRGADRAPVDYLFRLVGTAIVTVEGDCTGRYLSQLFSRESLPMAWRQYDDAATGQCWLRRETLGWQGRAHFDYWSLFLPLAADGTTIDMLAGCHYPTGEVGGPPSIPFV